MGLFLGLFPSKILLEILLPMDSITAISSGLCVCVCVCACVCVYVCVCVCE